MISARRRTLNVCSDLGSLSVRYNAISHSLSLFNNSSRAAFASSGGDGSKYSSTASRVDPERALNAYKRIPPSDRSPKDIKGAIAAACAQSQNVLAVQIHDEAVRRKPDPAVTIALVASLLRIGLWKEAAKIWGQLPRWQRMAGSIQTQEAWQEMDDLTPLPSILMQLANRLQPSVAPVATEGVDMHDFATQLLYRVFSSTRIMTKITGSAVLGLLNKFDSLELLRPSHYFAGIRTLNKSAGSRNRFQLATLLYRNLNTRFPDAKLTHSVLGSLINILCESENGLADSRTLLDRFARDWGKPDEKAYQRVLSACARNGEANDVREVFAEYCSHYVRPANLSYLTPLLYVYARLGNVEETKKQFDRLEPEFGLKPSAYCWNVLITAHTRLSDREGAFATFKLMKRAGIKPDESTYTMLMSLCAADGDNDAVYQLMETARVQGIRETVGMISGLVQSYCHSDHIEDAEVLVESATKLELKEPVTRMWNILLRHHAFRADTDAVLSTQDRMKKLSVPADDMTYAYLMQCLVNVRKTDEAAKILRSLHFSEIVSPTVSHYSIILWGYASENNRDMVTVIFNEMVTRFPRVGLSAKLSRLRNLIYRDTSVKRLRQDQALRGRPVEKGMQLPRGLHFFADTLLDVTFSDLATSNYQPGLGRRNSAEAFPSVLLESLIASFARNGAFEQVEKLLARYESLVHNMHGKVSNHPPSMNLLASMMLHHRQRQAYGAVETTWSQALSLAIRKGRRRTLDLSDPDPDTDMPEPPMPAVGPSSIDVGFKATSGITEPVLGRSSLSEQLDVDILPAHRHSLAAPLTEYMYSLSAQKCAARLPGLVVRLERMGFALTSKNWNHYIQSLAYSDDEELEKLAFDVFETQLLPNMPVWDLLRRGKWSKQRFIDGSADTMIEEPIERKFIERFRHETHVPTYWTMVYLALALMKFHQRDLRREIPGITELTNRAPGSVDAVTAMPYLREKAQGLLLRDRNLIGELQKRPRRPAEADRAGLGESRQLLDQIPARYPRDEVLQTLQHERVPFVAQTEEKRRDLLYLAENLTGEIRRTALVLEAAGRYESESERDSRLQVEERRKLRLLQQMRGEGQYKSLFDEEQSGLFTSPDLEHERRRLGSEQTSRGQIEEQGGSPGKVQDATFDVEKQRPIPPSHDGLPYHTQVSSVMMTEPEAQSRAKDRTIEGDRQDLSSPSSEDQTPKVQDTAAKLAEQISPTDSACRSPPRATGTSAENASQQDIPSTNKDEDIRTAGEAQVPVTKPGEQTQPALSSDEYMLDHVEESAAEAKQEEHSLHPSMQAPLETTERRSIETGQEKLPLGGNRPRVARSSNARTKIRIGRLRSSKSGLLEETRLPALEVKVEPRNRRVQSSTETPSDSRPPAILSSARRPVASARNYVVRQRRLGLRGQQLKMKDFRSDLKGKTRAALVAYQPPLRRPNRLLRAFTENRRRREERSERFGNKDPRDGRPGNS